MNEFKVFVTVGKKELERGFLMGYFKYEIDEQTLERCAHDAEVERLILEELKSALESDFYHIVAKQRMLAIGGVDND